MVAITPGGLAFAKTLPGITAPFGFFDPLGLTPESKEEVLLFREAELAHGRVAMMGALGYLVQEAFHPIFPDASGPVIRQLDEILSTEDGQFGGSILLMAIFFSEFHRARTGWVDPEIEMRSLREGYEPGAIGFDPLGMLPKDEAARVAMQTKELNNGRLAMIAIAGMTVQELVTDQTL